MLKKEAARTINGKKPARKIRIVTHMSAPAEIAAPVPINGASAHIDQEIRLGLVFPETVSRTYTEAPAIVINALRITSQCSNVIDV